MTLINSLRQEFEHEAQTTRKHFERLPDDKLGWRPHEKSFTAAALAAHIVEMIEWGDWIFSQDEVDFDPKTYKPYQPTSVADLLQTFDERVANCQRALASATDDALFQLWRMTVMGQTQVERPKMEAFREFTLSHVIHHRGQLTVYLRLLDIPVPESYGPTADEQS